jgi:hypothetical protein
MTATTMRAATARRGYIYVWMASACALLAFGGFAGTYWLQMGAGTFKGTPILHVHGLVFSAWTLLLLSQTVLAAQGRLQHHRAWGLAGISLATAMVFLGLTVALQGLNTKLAEGYGDQARAFMWLPLGSLGLFTGFFVAAIANLNRWEWHKRFMLVATCGALTAAAARIGFLIATGGGPGARPGLGPPPPPALGGADAAIVSLILLAGAIYDWRTRGKPHPAYLIGIAAILAFGFIGPFFAQTPAWFAFVDALAPLAR